MSPPGEGETRGESGGLKWSSQPSCGVVDIVGGKGVVFLGARAEEGIRCGEGLFIRRSGYIVEESHRTRRVGDIERSCRGRVES